ncbi:MAG: nucleoside diphosphate kinase regulator [Syntrophobacterales bacterium]|jgi:regulator of nucleoside diphosphate kinase|nr:nucleoside diphosphate kinase regulator [Syntrophobacterales bacterium]
MQERTIYITKFDFERLEELLAVAAEFSYRDRGDLEKLDEELQKGNVVDSMEVPPNVVTMNSRVRLLDVEKNQSMVYTLVFPKDADLDAGKLSVLSPIGTAIFGYSVGDVIEWQVPKGMRRIKIEQVLYQPEAAGDYHL